MQKNTVLGLLAGAVLGAAGAVATVQDWQHFLPKNGTLASYISCIEKFDVLNDDGEIARKTCKARHVRQLGYQATSSFRAAISKDSNSIRIWADEGDGQDYERIEGIIGVFEGGKAVKEIGFVARSLGQHPGKELEGKLDDFQEVEGISWCPESDASEDEDQERCLDWGVRGLYGLSHG